jgi:RNA polymerase sigma-70 factor (ECF subfamily)
MSTRAMLVTAVTAPSNDIPDDDLVRRSQRGDRAALELLVRRHQRALFALCLRYVGSPDEAADLVQRSFLRVMAKLGELRDPSVFRGWLLRIGAHLALNHIRDHARFVSDDEQPERAAAPDHPEALPAVDRLEAAEAAAALRAAIGELPTKQRMTVELRLYEDLSFRDIADALGTTEGAAKVNFHYEVRRLRALMAPAAEGWTALGRGRILWTTRSPPGS